MVGYGNNPPLLTLGVRDQLDLYEPGALTQEIRDLLEKSENVMEQAKRADLNTEEDFGSAGDLVKIITGLEKTSYEKRLSATEPFRNITTLINKSFKPIDDLLTDAKSAIKSKMRFWQQQEDKRRQAEAKARREALEREALERASHAPPDEQDAVLDAAAAASEELGDRAALGLTRGGLGSTVGQRKVVTGEVTDLEQFVMSLSKWRGLVLPDDIITIKQGKLNALAKKAKEQDLKIPGLAINETVDINVR